MVNPIFHVRVHLFTHDRKTFSPMEELQHQNISMHSIRETVINIIFLLHGNEKEYLLYCHIIPGRI